MSTAIERKQRHWMFRRPFAASLLMLVAGGTTWAAYGSLAQHPPGPIVEQVSQGTIETVVAAVGKIQPRAYVNVGAQASGQLRRIFVKVGDKVRVGQRLAEIDPQMQEAKVAAGRAELARLEATLEEQQALTEFADAQLARSGQLIERNTVSRSTFDENRRNARTSAAKVKAIRAQIEQMQSTLKVDEVALTYTKIDAPMSGTVLSIDAREGQTLNANYSAPQIMRIADLDQMTVWTEVSEADVTRLRIGMDVYFTTLGHGERRWEAKLRQILPAPQKPEQPSGNAPTSSAAASSNNVVLYIALFDVDNAGGELLPEMTAQVSFVTASAKDAVLVPVAALRSADGQPYTSGDTAKIEVDNGGGRIERRTVRIGVRDRFTAQVLEGLQEGESVVAGARKDGTARSRVGFSL